MLLIDYCHGYATATRLFSPRRRCRLRYYYMIIYMISPLAPLMLPVVAVAAQLIYGHVAAAAPFFAQLRRRHTPLRR